MYSTTIYRILGVHSNEGIEFEELLEVTHEFGEFGGEELNEWIQCQDTCLCQLDSVVEEIQANHAANVGFVNRLLGEPRLGVFKEASSAIGELVLNRDYSSDPLVSVNKIGRLTRLNAFDDYELWVGELPEEDKIRYIWLESTRGKAFENPSTWESGFGVRAPWVTYVDEENDELPYALNCFNTDQCRFFDPRELRISTTFPDSTINRDGDQSVAGYSYFRVTAEFSWCPEFGSSQSCE